MQKWSRNGASLSNSDSEAFAEFIRNRDLLKERDEKIKSLSDRVDRLESMIEKVLQNEQK